MSLDNPTVVIVGGGAMGGLFGGLLSEGDLDVTLLDTWHQHVEAIREKGLSIVGHGGDRVIPIKATTDGGDIETADIVLFQCKASAMALARLEMPPFISPR